MSATAPVSAALDLGWLVVCLPAIDFEKSMDYYERVGFVTVGGQPDNGWVVMGAGRGEINPMRGLDSVWLNFRGADVPALASELESRGFTLRDNNVFDPEKWPSELWNSKDGRPLPIAGSGDFFVDDPDGNVIYFDTVPIERVRHAAGETRASEGFEGQWREGQPRLGNFELALKVTDLQRSSEFYQRLGLAQIESSERSALFGSVDHNPTRLRLWQAVAPGVLLRFTDSDNDLVEKFRVSGLQPELHEGKAILTSPDGLRLKFLFSA